MNDIMVYEWQQYPIEFRMDGYVNATEMARPFGKLPNDFSRLPKVQEYIDALESITGLSRNTLVISTPGNGPHSGSWFHPKLAIRFAQWLDQRFAVWVDSRIEQLLTTGRTEIHSSDPSAFIAQAVIIAQRVIDDLQHKIQRDEHKVQSYETFLSANNNLTMNQAAKSLNQEGITIGRNRLFDFLRDQGVLMADNSPYQHHIDAKRFKVIIRPIEMGTQTMNKTQTLVTPKGMDYIRNLLQERYSMDISTERMVADAVF